MPSSSSKFPTTSERYTPSSSTAVPGAILPQNSHLDGQFQVIFPLQAPHLDRIRLRIRCEYSQATLANDYVAPSPSRKIKWKFTVHLLPAEDVRNNWTNPQQAMNEEYRKLDGLLGQQIRLVADDMRITNVDGRDVVIEARGARVLWTESKGAWTIFTGEHRRVQRTSIAFRPTHYYFLLIVQSTLNQELHHGLNHLKSLPPRRQAIRQLPRSLLFDQPAFGPSLHISRSKWVCDRQRRHFSQRRKKGNEPSHHRSRSLRPLCPVGRSRKGI